MQERHVKTWLKANTDQFQSWLRFNANMQINIFPYLYVRFELDESRIVMEREQIKLRDGQVSLCCGEWTGELLSCGGISFCPLTQVEFTEFVSKKTVQSFRLQWQWNKDGVNLQNEKFSLLTSLD